MNIADAQRVGLDLRLFALAAVTGIALALWHPFALAGLFILVDEVSDRISTERR